MQVEWRCRAKLAVRGTSEDPHIGLFEEGTHSIVDIPFCRSRFQFCAILDFWSKYSLHAIVQEDYSLREGIIVLNPLLVSPSKLHCSMLSKPGLNTH